MSYLFQLTKGVNNNHDIVYLNDDCKQDVKMWGSILQHWNGVSFLKIAQLQIKILTCLLTFHLLKVLAVVLLENGSRAPSQRSCQ